LKRAGYLLASHTRPPHEEENLNEAVLENLKQIHERDIQKLKERLLRSHADLENLRKRSSRERQETIKFANESLISYILPVLDNFTHAFQASEKTGDLDSYKEGIELIYRQLMKVLEESGLEAIESMEKPFDPHFHEAISTEYREETPDNQVIDVVRSGYLLKGRVIRPAMVRVNKKPQEAKARESAVKPNPKIKPEPLEQPDQTGDKTNA